MVETGYGIRVSPISWKPDFAETARGMLPPGLKRDWEDFKNGLEEDENALFEEFAESYVNPTYLWGGKAGLLCDMINEAEFSGKASELRYGNGWLYMPAVMPEDEEERGRLATLQQLREILLRYLGRLADTVPYFDYVEFADYGA